MLYLRRYIFLLLHVSYNFYWMNIIFWVFGFCWVGKTLLYFFFTLLTQLPHFPSAHQICQVFFSPHIKQFSDTSWLSYSVTQIWHYLSRDSISSRRLRAQPHKIAPLQLQMLLQVPGCHLYLWLTCHESGFPWPLS